jgi:hypothetical protein
MTVGPFGGGVVSVVVSGGCVVVVVVVVVVVSIVPDPSFPPHAANANPAARAITPHAA